MVQVKLVATWRTKLLTLALCLSPPNWISGRKKNSIKPSLLDPATLLPQQSGAKTLIRDLASCFLPLHCLTGAISSTLKDNGRLKSLDCVSAKSTGPHLLSENQTDLIPTKRNCLLILITQRRTSNTLHTTKLQVSLICRTDFLGVASSLTSPNYTLTPSPSETSWGISSHLISDQGE